MDISSNTTATIPDMLISLKTLIYLGLLEDKATEIWSYWTNWPSFDPRREIDPNNGYDSISFIDIIVCPLDNYRHLDVRRDDDERWVDCLNACGLSTHTQDAIMDPNFKNIRLTESCLFWVKDTINMRWTGLKETQRTARGGTSRSNSGSQAQEGQVEGQASPTHLWNSDYANRLGEPEDDQNKNNIILFKGTYLANTRIYNLLNNDGTINELGDLASSTPTDFHSYKSIFSFAKDYPVAEYHAAYAKRRSSKYESIFIVVLTLPKDILYKLEEPELQRLYSDSPEWKQLVWYSRLGKSVPKPLRKYRKAMLTIGHNTRGFSDSDSDSEQYKDLESWEGVVTDGFTLHVPTTPEEDKGKSKIAVQYAFSADDDGCDFLKEHGRIEVFLFSNEDMQALLRRYA